MIHLHRERTQQAIKAKYRGKKKIDKEFSLLKEYRDSGGSPQFTSSWWSASKKQLKLEANEKCAYCEADVATVAYGDVEHFRPKSEYWWLAYCHDNYLYSCQICNQTYKGKQFPIHGTAMGEPIVNSNDSDADLKVISGSLAPDPLDEETRYTLNDYWADAKREKPGLPNPYMEDPEQLFQWEVDLDNKEVRIKRLTNTVRARRAFDAAEKYLGLNREQLCRARWVVYRVLVLLKDVLESLQNDGNIIVARIEEEIKLMMADNAPFAGMVRYFVRDEWHLLV